MENTILELGKVAEAFTSAKLSPPRKSSTKPTAWDELLEFAKETFEGLRANGLALQPAAAEP